MYSIYSHGREICKDIQVTENSMNSRKKVGIHVHKGRVGRIWGKKMGFGLHLVDMDNPQKTSHHEEEWGYVTGILQTNLIAIQRRNNLEKGLRSGSHVRSLQ